MNRKQISAKVIADSYCETRLTTIEVTFHRYILSEMNTHRVFSRNSASSRAVPVKKQIDQILTNPALPVQFGTNQPGMQSGLPLTGNKEFAAICAVLKMRDAAITGARELQELNVHKEVINRYLEPFMWHTVIITADLWDNFFNLRDSDLAQPEMMRAAQAMRIALAESTPRMVRFQNEVIPATNTIDNWHLPYISEDELELPITTLQKVSAARCARVSYLTHDGIRDIEKDLVLYERLVSSGHASPLEHVATPSDPYDSCPGNFYGWRQLRHEVLDEVRFS